MLTNVIPRPLARKRNQIALIRELAAGEKTQQELADQYGITQPSIAQFKANHAQEIQEVLDGIEYPGLWIANKEKRIASVQEIVDRIEELETIDSPLLNVQLKAARQVAEELGQLIQKTEVNQTVLSYTIEGVDMDTLR